MNLLIKTYPLSSGQVIEIAQGDLTKEHVDAIVNAANSRLAHGGGVAGAIRSAGGQQIIDESEAWVREHGPVTNAEPAYTNAGNLSCRFVIHAVGPIWGEGDEDRKLQDAVTGSLKRAEELKAHSLALPAISTGIFGFPLERAARIILETLRAYFVRNPMSGIRTTRIVLHDDKAVRAFTREGV